MQIISYMILFRTRGKSWDLIKEQSDFPDRMYIRRNLWDLVEIELDLQSMILSPDSTWIGNVR